MFNIFTNAVTLQLLFLTRNVFCIFFWADCNGISPLHLRYPVQVSCEDAYLKYSNGCPKDVIKMLPVALTFRVMTNNFGACAIAFVARVVHKLAKLTTEQIHSQNTASPRCRCENERKRKRYAQNNGAGHPDKFTCAKHREYLVRAQHRFSRWLNASFGNI